MKFIYSAKDKRSKDGTILKYVIRNQTAKIAKQCVNELKINKFYNIFIKNFDNDLIDFYFLNYFFDKIYSTIAKIHIHKWNKTNSKIIQPEIIEIPNFEFIEIFEKFWPEKELNYKIKNFYFEDNGIKISYFRYLLIRLLDFVKNINFYFIVKFKNIKNINKIYTDPMIAISYREGLDKNKRSDIFWYNENQINPENIIIYFNNYFSMNRYEGFNSLLRSLEKYRFKWVSLFRINYKYNKNYFQKNQKIISNDFRNLFNQLYTFNNTGNNFKLNKYFFINLLRKINYWYNFTYIYNIKILYDPIEFSGDLILLNIALKLNNGCSFRHQRSLIVGKESHFGFYPQNIFFAWGKNSCNKFFENTNITENLIISGHPYRQKNINNSYQESVHKKLKSKGVKFTFLLLDNNHSMNFDHEQYIYTPKLELFYNFFLNLVINNPQIGIIIKSKKNIDFTNLFKNNDLYNKALQTGRCEYVENPLGYKPLDFAKNTDLVVATSTFLSGALIESVLEDVRGIFYDYPNIKNIDKQLYKWGENRVIFNDLDIMFDRINSYIKDHNNDNLGDWIDHIDDYDSFKDRDGNKRIGFYIKSLHSFFLKNYDYNKSINEANLLYSKNWGKDKIFYSK